MQMTQIINHEKHEIHEKLFSPLQISKFFHPFRGSTIVNHGKTRKKESACMYTEIRFFLIPGKKILKYSIHRELL
jgi:hypothetical protein